MICHPEFDELRGDSESWWYATRRKLLREAAMQGIHATSDAGMVIPRLGPKRVLELLQALGSWEYSPPSQA